MPDPTYDDVVRANVELHSRLADDYARTEPHFRPENVARVAARLREIAAPTRRERLLDLGCGTGFMIQIGKEIFPRVTGVDVTQAMLDKVDRSGPATIELHRHDTGSFPAEPGSYDVVTAYSFLHHLFDVEPTLRTAHRALRSGGRIYADLEPNFYFWEGIRGLAPGGALDPIVVREIAAVSHRDEEIEAQFGVGAETFNRAEFGKAVAGGFREEDLRAALERVGFADVRIEYNWFLGQASTIHDSRFAPERRAENARLVDETLQRALPLSRGLYKYLGFVATKP
jgi:SAM-dependent methyltransferase